MDSHLWCSTLVRQGEGPSRQGDPRRDIAGVAPFARPPGGWLGAGTAPLLVGRVPGGWGLRLMGVLLCWGMVHGGFGSVHASPVDVHASSVDAPAPSGGVPLCRGGDACGTEPGGLEGPWLCCVCRLRCGVVFHAVPGGGAAFAARRKAGRKGRFGGCRIWRNILT